MKLLPFEYASRSLGRRPLRSLLGICGCVLVVLLVMAAVAFVHGMRRSLTVTGTPGNVVLLGTGSEESIERSQIDVAVATIAEASLPGLRRQLGVGYLSPEVHVALSVREAPDGEAGPLTVVRGVTERALLVHPQVRLTAGRAPEPGRDEIAVGRLVATQLDLSNEDLPLGSALWIDERAWTIVGRFEAPHTVMDGEIWMPLTDLQIVARRDSLSCVVLTLESDRDFADVELFATQRLDLEITAMRERDYYLEMAAFMAPVRGLILITAALIALGGVLGGLNTMYAAFAARAREIGALRVLGFRRVAIVLSLLQESLLLNAVGAIVGVAAGLLLFDGLAIRMSMGAFGLIVDGGVVAIGLLAGLLLGLVGTIPPAWRCLRLPIPEALRSN